MYRHRILILAQENVPLLSLTVDTVAAAASAITPIATAALFYSMVNDTDALNCCFIHQLMSPKLLLNSSVFHR